MNLVSFMTKGISFAEDAYNKLNPVYQDKIEAQCYTGQFNGHVMDFQGNKSYRILDGAVHILTVSETDRIAKLNMWNGLWKQSVAFTVTATVITVAGAIAASTSSPIIGVVLAVSGLAATIFGIVRTIQASNQHALWQDPIEKIRNQRIRIGQEGGVEFASHERLKGVLVHVDELSERWIQEAKTFFPAFAKFHRLDSADKTAQRIKHFFDHNLFNFFNYAVTKKIGNSHIYDIAESIKAKAYDPLKECYDRLRNSTQRELDRLEQTRQAYISDNSRKWDMALEPARLMRNMQKETAQNEYLRMVAGPLAIKERTILNVNQNSRLPNEARYRAVQEAENAFENNPAVIQAKQQRRQKENRADLIYTTISTPINLYFESRANSINQEAQDKSDRARKAERDLLIKYIPDVEEIASSFVNETAVAEQKKYAEAYNFELSAPSAPVWNEFFHAEELNNQFSQDPEMQSYISEYGQHIQKIYPQI